jgi:ABC-type oligopeptide transport system substrate-binding subunit
MRIFEAPRGLLEAALCLAAVCGTLAACRPAEPEMVVVTEVVHLGDEQIVITRMVELLPTATATVPPPVSAPEPVALDVAYEDSLPNLDPQHAAGKASLDLAESLFAGLTNFSHERQQVEPELAESWRVSGDGRTWTFTLRDDIYWVKPISSPADLNQATQPEPVRPVDALDVVYAFQRACTKKNAVTDAFLLFVIEGCQQLFALSEPSNDDLGRLGVKALDARTVQISLTGADASFLTITALPQFRPVPRELVEEHGDEWRDAAGEFADGWQTPENLVVSGPFVPSGTLSDQGAGLARSAIWPLPASGNVDMVNIQFQVDEMDSFQAWQRRDLDLSRLPASEREAFLETSPEKARLITNQTVFYLGYNFESPVFSEAPIRRAFSAAIDRSSLVSSMFGGRGQELRHLTPPGVFGAPPVGEVGVGYSPDFALQQMDQSSVRNCKLLPPITFLVSTADLSLLQAELIRDMWIKELGCDEQLITVEQVDFGTLLANTAANSEGHPDIWELAWPGYYPDAHNVLTDLLHCTEGENRQRRGCGDVDRLMIRARTTSDPEERIDLYRQIENDFFSSDGIFPLVPLYVRGDYLLVQNWLDFPPALSGGEQFDTYRVDQELKRLERDRR